jgi:hypothetical protein
MKDATSFGTAGALARHERVRANNSLDTVNSYDEIECGGTSPARAPAVPKESLRCASGLSI